MSVVIIKIIIMVQMMLTINVHDDDYNAADTGDDNIGLKL